MLLSPLCPLLFQPLLAAAQQYSQTLELGKLGIYLQGFAMERKREEEETRGCFSRNPVLRMEDFVPADLLADSLKPEFQNRKKMMACARKMTGKHKENPQLLSNGFLNWVCSSASLQLSSPSPCSAQECQRKVVTHTHMQTQTRIHQLQK